MRTCFKVWPTKNLFRQLWGIQSLIVAWLQIYRELLWLATFFRVHSNSKEVSYLSWQNKYPNLKTTFYIKLSFFLWAKLVENLLLAKNVISIAAALRNIDIFGKLVEGLMNEVKVKIITTRKQSLKCL